MKNIYVREDYPELEISVILKILHILEVQIYRKVAKIVQIIPVHPSLNCD